MYFLSSACILRERSLGPASISYGFIFSTVKTGVVNVISSGNYLISTSFIGVKGIHRVTLKYLFRIDFQH